MSQTNKNEYLQFIGWVKNPDEVYLLYFHQLNNIFLICNENNENDFFKLNDVKINDGNNIIFNEKKYIIALNK